MRSTHLVDHVLGHEAGEQVAHALALERDGQVVQREHGDGRPPAACRSGRRTTSTVPPLKASCAATVKTTPSGQRQRERAQRREAQARERRRQPEQRRSAAMFERAGRGRQREPAPHGVDRVRLDLRARHQLRRPAVEVGWTSCSDGADGPTTHVLVAEEARLDACRARRARTRPTRSCPAARGSRSRRCPRRPASPGSTCSPVPASTVATPSVSIPSIECDIRRITPPGSFGKRPLPNRAPRSSVSTFCGPPRNLPSPLLVHLGRREHDAALRAPAIASASARSESKLVARLRELDVVADRRRLVGDDPVDHLAVEPPRERPAHAPARRT